MKLTINLNDANERENAKVILELFDEDVMSDDEPVAEEVYTLPADAPAAEEELEAEQPEVVVPKASLDPTPEPQPEPEVVPEPEAPAIPELAATQELAKKLVDSGQVSRTELISMIAKYGVKAVRLMSDADRANFHADCLAQEGEANVG